MEAVEVSEAVVGGNNAGGYHSARLVYVSRFRHHCLLCAHG